MRVASLRPRLPREHRVPFEVGGLAPAERAVVEDAARSRAAEAVASVGAAAVRAGAKRRRGDVEDLAAAAARDDQVLPCTERDKLEPLKGVMRMDVERAHASGCAKGTTAR